MNAPCRSHRTPAGKPIRSAVDAAWAVNVATEDGCLDCVVIACVDHHRSPLTMFILDGHRGLDDELELAVDAVVAAAPGSPLAAMFLASSRPDGPYGPTEDDERRWVRLAARCAGAGIELLDWFIVGRGAICSAAEGLTPGPGW